MSIYYLLAVYLIASAIGKLWLVITSPFADMIGGGFPLQVLWLAIIIEFALVILVFSRTRKEYLWLAFTAFFMTVTVVSTIRWLQGFQSCGCFGVLELPIWLTVAINMFVLALLWFIREPISQLFKNIASWWHSVVEPEDNMESQRAKRHFGFLMAIVFCASLTLLSAFNPFYGWITSFAGQQIVSTKRSSHELLVNTDNIVQIPVWNSSDEDLRILGSKSSCVCALLENEENLIKANQRSILAFRVRPEREGRWHQRVVCFLSHPQQKNLVIDLWGQVDD